MELRHVLRVFLASPGDTAPERKIVREVVDGWNRSVGARRGWHVDVFGYETHAAPDYGSDGQAIINRQAGDMRRYALFIGILKHRFGAPTPRAESGTQEEFNRAVNAYKRAGRLRIMLYFSTAPFAPRGDDDMKQKQKVLDFRKKVQPLSLYGSYRTQQEFRKYFSEHFHGWMKEQMKAASKAQKARRVTSGKKQPAPKTPAVPKTPKARQPKTKVPAKERKTVAAPQTVSSSGAWLLLDGHLLWRKKVSEERNQLTLEIVPRDGEEESVLRRLCNSHHYAWLAYAHGRDAGQLRLDGCRHESHDKGSVWIVQASLNRAARSGWLSPEEVERRVRQLLLGDPEPAQTPRDQSFYGGWPMTGHVKSSSPLFATLWAQMADRRSEFLHAAFLHAVQKMKSEGLCEDVLELKLGPIKNGALAVRFRGRCSAPYSGVAAPILEVQGACVLEESAGKAARA